MRTVDLQPLSIRTSVLGFGCASLGSRIDEKDGLVALERAFAAGVSWYDTAPSYGDGRGEDILSKFLAGHRDGVTVCTKVGFVATKPYGPIAVVAPLLRKLVAAAPALRATIRRARPPSAVRLPLNGHIIKASLAGSLHRLGIGRLDVLALHEPDPADVIREDVIRALEDVVAAGDVRYVSVAGSTEAVLAARAAGAPVSLAQVADNLFERNAAALRRALGTGQPFPIITHSVYGVAGARAKLQRLIETDSSARRRLAAAGYGGEPDVIVGSVLLDYALAGNDNGVVLVSMLQERHLAANVARAGRPPNASVVPLIEELIAPARRRLGA
jgi:aryl-alcohol dehydrogenase-like predicted oxidoreductase